MSYNVLGTVGNDTLNQTVDNGPGTIVGLAGGDCILAGLALVSVIGDSGSDTIVLQDANTGTVHGGTENDSIVSNRNSLSPVLPSIGSMQLFGGEGADVIDVISAASLTIVGGDDSNDGPDSIGSGTGGDIIFGNGGNDTVNDSGGNNTIVLGFGTDSLSVAEGSSLVFGNQGNDTMVLPGTGTSTVFGGSGDDSLRALAAGLVFGNEGNDTIDARNTDQAMTVVGGNDSADGSDVIVTGRGADFLFGNGGDDTILGFDGDDTMVAGAGHDFLRPDNGITLTFGNEGNDTVRIFTAGQGTVFGGLGDDIVVTGNDAGRDLLQGNEGNDTIEAFGGIDTISGGSGSDRIFLYDAHDDGDNAAGGGPVEFITDLDFGVDRLDTFVQVTFAANVGAGTGVNLAASAGNAIAAAVALSGNPAAVAAAQFTFGGRTYLAIDQANAGFNDTDDLLIDITGASGTITAASFLAHPPHHI
jgi:Ca2+-binding RTX toxin-like protein